MDPLMSALIAGVYLAGEGARFMARTPTMKSDEDGHRTIVTEADLQGQSLILSHFPNDAIFIAEEDSADPRVLPKENVGELAGKKVVVVDPTDGTSLYTDKQPNWSVAG